jgi:hypothetical protein
MRHIPDSRHARKLESEVFDSERLGQTEDEHEAASAHLRGTLILCLSEPLTIKHLRLQLTGMSHIPDSRHARKLESEVFDSERLGQTEDESAPQMGTSAGHSHPLFVRAAHYQTPPTPAYGHVASLVCVAGGFMFTAAEDDIFIIQPG